MAIEWAQWKNQAESAVNARQIRSDGESISRKRIFGFHSVEQLDRKRLNNAKDFNANLGSLSDIQKSLVAEFGRAVGQAVFNQVFLTKIQYARPISASDIRLADSLGKNLTRGLEWLASLDGRENAEKALSQVFHEVLIEDVSRLSPEKLTQLGQQVSERLQLAKTLLEDDRRSAAQAEIGAYLQDKDVLTSYLRAALLLQGEDRTAFLVDVRKRFGVNNLHPLTGAAATNQSIHKQLEAVIKQYEAATALADVEAGLLVRQASLATSVHKLEQEKEEVSQILGLATERQAEKVAAHAQSQEQLRLKEAAVNDLEIQIKAFDVDDKTHSEDFQRQLQPSFARLEALSKDVAASSAEAEVLQQEQSALRKQTTVALTQFEERLAKLDATEGAEKPNIKKINKAKAKLEADYQKIVKELSKKIEAFDNTPQKGSAYSRGQRLNILNQQLDNANLEKQQIESFIQEQVQKRTSSEQVGSESSKLTALQQSLYAMQKECRDLAEQVRTDAQVVQFASSHVDHMSQQLVDVIQRLSVQAADLGLIERDLSLLKAQEAEAAKKIRFAVGQDVGTQTNLADVVTDMVSDHAKISLIFSGRLDPATLEQPELERLLVATDQVLLDHPVFMSISHSPFWRLSRSRLEEALLPQLSRERRALVELGDAASQEQKLRLAQLNNLLKRTPELPIPSGLKPDELTKHRATESEARVHLASALSDIRAGISPAEAALAIPFDAELRQSLHQLLAIRQMGGLYPGKTNLEAEQSLEDALEETALLPLFQNDIRQTGKINVQRYQEVLTKRQGEAAEILALRNEATLALTNLRELYAAENQQSATAITEQTRHEAEHALISISEITDELKAKHEQAQETQRLLQKRIQLAQKLEHIDETSPEYLKLYAPYIEQAKRDHAAAVVANKPEQVTVDPIEEVSSQPILSAALRAKAQAALSGVLSDGVGDNGEALDSRNVAVTLSRLGFKTNRTLADGNCFYHAVAVQLTTPLTVGQLRTQVADEAQAIVDAAIKDPKSLPKDILYELTPAQIQATRFEATMNSTSEERIAAWGEVDHCTYVARVTNRPVVIFTADRGLLVFEKNQPMRQIEFAVRTDIPHNAILLAHNGSDHWESVSLNDDQLAAFAPGTVIAASSAEKADASAADAKRQLDESLKKLEQLSESLTIRARFLNPPALQAPIDKTPAGVLAYLSSGTADISQLSIQDLQSCLSAIGNVSDELSVPADPKRALELTAFKLAKDSLVLKVQTDLSRTNRAIAENQQTLNQSGWNSSAAVTNARLTAFLLRDKSAQNDLDALDAHKKQLAALKFEREELLKISNDSYDVGKEKRYEYLLGASLSLLRTKKDYDPFISARQIVSEGCAQRVIDELRQRRLLVTKQLGTAALFDTASQALLEACEVAQYAQSVQKHLLENGGQYPEYAHSLQTAQAALKTWQDQYNPIYKDLVRDRALIERYEKASAVKRLALSKGDYDLAVERAKSELADINRLMAPLAAAESLVDEINHKAKLLQLLNEKYPDAIKAYQLNNAQRVGARASTIFAKV